MYLKRPQLKDHKNEQSFIKAFEKYDADYRFLIDLLREALEKRGKGTLTNIHGKGYVLLFPYKNLSK